MKESEAVIKIQRLYRKKRILDKQISGTNIGAINSFSKYHYSGNLRKNIYGLKTIKTDLAFPALGINFYDPNSTFYQRTDSKDKSGVDDFALFFLEEHEKVDFKSKVFLVNSLKCVNKLKILYPKIYSKTSFNISEIPDTGMYKLISKNNLNPNLLTSIGALVTNYQIIQNYKKFHTIADTHDKTIINVDDIKIKYKKIIFFSNKKLRCQSDDLLSKVTHELLFGLNKVIKNTSEGNLNEIYEALNNIEYLIEHFYDSYKNKYLSRQFKIFELIIEEVNQIIIECDDCYNYNQITSEILNKRNYIPDNIIPFNIMTSSGMDSITCSLTSAIKATSKPIIYGLKQEDGDYYETTDFDLSNYSRKYSDVANIYYLTFDSSLPEQYFNFSELHSNIEKSLESVATGENNFINIIIDTTLELVDKKLEKFIFKYKNFIEDGKISITLCKSLQKFSDFAVSKANAGNISVLNSGEQKFSDYNKHIQELGLSSDSQNKHENRIVKHVLANTNHFEFVFLEQILSRVDFLKRYIFNDSSSDIKFFENSPLILFPKQAGSTIISSGVTERGSFGGILNSHVVFFDSQKQPFERVSIGLESYSRLVEQFYFLGHLYSKDIDSQIKSGKIILKEYTDDLFEHMLYLLKEIDPNENYNLKVLFQNGNYKDFFSKIHEIMDFSVTEGICKYSLNAIGSLILKSLKLDISEFDSFFKKNDLIKYFIEKELYNLSPDFQKEFAINFLYENLISGLHANNIVKFFIDNRCNIKNCFLSLSSSAKLTIISMLPSDLFINEISNLLLNDIILTIDKSIISDFLMHTDEKFKLSMFLEILCTSDLENDIELLTLFFNLCSKRLKSLQDFQLFFNELRPHSQMLFLDKMPVNDYIKFFKSIILNIASLKSIFELFDSSRLEAFLLKFNNYGNNFITDVIESCENLEKFCFSLNPEIITLLHRNINFKNLSENQIFCFEDFKKIEELIVNDENDLLINELNKLNFFQLMNLLMLSSYNEFLIEEYLVLIIDKINNENYILKNDFLNLVKSCFGQAGLNYLIESYNYNSDLYNKLLKGLTPSQIEEFINNIKNILSYEEFNYFLLNRIIYDSQHNSGAHVLDLVNQDDIAAFIDYLNNYDKRYSFFSSLTNNFFSEVRLEKAIIGERYFKNFIRRLNANNIEKFFIFLLNQDLEREYVLKFRSNYIFRYKDALFNILECLDFNQSKTLILIFGIVFREAQYSQVLSYAVIKMFTSNSQMSNVCHRLCLEVSVDLSKQVFKNLKANLNQEDYEKFIDIISLDSKSYIVDSKLLEDYISNLKSILPSEKFRDFINQNPMCSEYIHESSGKKSKKSSF